MNFFNYFPFFQTIPSKPQIFLLNCSHSKNFSKKEFSNVFASFFDLIFFKLLSCEKKFANTHTSFIFSPKIKSSKNYSK